MRFHKIAIFEVKELLYFPRNTLIEIQVIFTNEFLFLKIFAIFSIWGKCIVSPLAHLNEEKQTWNVNHSKFAAFLDCVHAAFNCNFVFGHSCLFISPLATLFPDLVTLFHSPSKIKCYQIDGGLSIPRRIPDDGLASFPFDTIESSFVDEGGDWKPRPGPTFSPSI